MRLETIVCGVDGSEAGFEALAQARRLLAPGGRLVAVTACDEALAVHAGLHAPRVAASLRAEAEAARALAEQELAGVEGAVTEVVPGRPVDVLRRAVARERADLLVLGDHGTRRPVGMLLGSAATTLLREEPTAVLVARGPTERGFPRSVVVGVDASPAAVHAHEVAASLAGEAGASLRVVAADRRPVAALEAASADADLVVVGSRGLRGVAAIGSVSERVAHRARSSVLVVPAPQAATTT